MKITNNLYPAAIYENAKLQKKQILQENQGKTGIYRWTCLKTGEFYVGRSLNLSKRFKHYFSLKYLKGSKGSSHIYRSLLKHGYSNFTLEILEYCDPAVIIQREQHYINSLYPKYNILKIAGSSQGYKHDDGAKAKISAAHLGIQKSALCMNINNNYLLLILTL
jgi:group I intron endonuclease